MSEQSHHKEPLLPLIEHDAAPSVEQSDDRAAGEPHTHIGATAVDLTTPQGGEAPGAPPDAPNTDPTKNEPTAFLSSMRTHLRLSGKRLAQYKMPPPEYQPAFVSLLRINKNHNLQAKNRLSDTIAGRFLMNLIRFRQETGLNPGDRPELSPLFLEELYAAYAQDIEGFREYPLPKPELMALFHPRQILTDLDTKYDGHPFVVKKDITMAFGSKRYDPQSALDILTTRVYEFNSIEPRLRAEYGVEGKWELTFIRNLCRASESAENQARTIFERTRELRRQYPNARPEVVGSWAQASVTDKWGRGREVSQILSEIPSIEWSEDEALQGSEQLNRLRQARRDDHVDGRKNITNVRWAAAATRLIRIAEHNWHNGFDAIDMPMEASRVWAGAKTYNENLRENEADMTISLEPEHLYYILTAFAEDAARLKEEVPASYVSLIAWHHAPGIYDQYLKRYENDQLITPAILRFIISTAPRNIENKIAVWFENMHSLQESFADRIGLDNLRRLAHLPNVLNAAKNFLAFEKTAKENHPWAIDSEIEKFFFDYEEPGVRFEEWAGKVEEIRRLRPSLKKFPLYRCKDIAYGEGTAHEVIQAYKKRLEEILTAYKKEPRIERSHAAWWASHYAISYLDSAKAHLKCAAEIEKQLAAKAGITLDPQLVGRLAFKTDTSKVGKRIELFLEQKSWLETKIRYIKTPNPVEQWMVDQVAASNRTNQQYLLRKVATLAAIAAKGGIFGMRHVRLDEEETNKDGRNFSSKHQRNFAQASDNAAKSRELIEEYFSWLAPQDRMAVAVVFGFIEDADRRSELQEELQVDDLDKYVLDEVVPYISRLSRERTL